MNKKYSNQFFVTQFLFLLRYSIMYINNRLLLIRQRKPKLIIDTSFHFSFLICKWEPAGLCLLPVTSAQLIIYKIEVNVFAMAMAMTVYVRSTQPYPFPLKRVKKEYARDKVSVSMCVQQRLCRRHELEEGEREYFCLMPQNPFHTH